MHTFGLAGANNDVGERCAVLKDEHGVLLASLRLTLAYGSCKLLVKRKA